MLVTKELLSPDMTYGRCTAAVERSVRTLDGVSSVKADAGTKLVVVEYDESNATVDDIRNRIMEAGCAAEEMADGVN